jgi:cytoplasmic tRNA 2-thiolation protein 1
MPSNRNSCHVEGESLSVREGVHLAERGTCSRCGFVSSQKLCKACVLLDGLNRGLPRLGIGKSSKANRVIVGSKKVNPRTTGDF